MAGRTILLGPGSALTGLRASLWRKVPVLWQTEAQECGVVCIAMVTAYHGRDLDLAELRARGLAGSRGSTLTDLVALGEAEGMNCRGLKLEVEHLQRLAAPAVLHWDLNHFVVLVKVLRRGAWIHDPAEGRRWYSWAELSKHFTGVALELRPSDRFRARPLARRLKLSDLWRGAVGLGGSLVNVLALSLLLQVTLVLAPLQVQWVIDHGVMRADSELIALLALGFAMLLLVRLAAQVMRGWLITRLAFLLAFDFWPQPVRTHVAAAAGLVRKTPSRRHRVAVRIAWPGARRDDPGARGRMRGRAHGRCHAGDDACLRREARGTGTRGLHALPTRAVRPGAGACAHLDGRDQPPGAGGFQLS